LAPSDCQSWVSLGTGLRGFKQAMGGDGLSNPLSAGDKEHTPTTEHVAPIASVTPVASDAQAAVAPLTSVQDKRSA
jgi:hypothetical protein